MLACKRFAQALNLLPITIPVMIVGGTNGKGSCVAITESILRAEGYKVGSYYSPHLFHFNERIRINHQPVDDLLIQQSFEMIDSHSKHYSLTYFEKTTLAALMIYRQFKLDALILEVGLGGRFDATNMIDADVSVITSIDLDHMEILGNTRDAIGFEKAGIFRYQKPAICADPDIPDSVIKTAHQIGALLYCYNKEYFFKEEGESWSWWNQKSRINHLPKPSLDLPNATAAIAALKEFPLKVSDEAIKAGLKNVFLPGRFQIVEKPIRQIFDVAHNPAAAKLLAKKLSTLSCRGKTYAVVGMLKDKDISSTLLPLIPFIDEWYLGGLALERGAKSDVLANALKENLNHLNKPNTPIFQFDDIKSAFDACKSHAKPHDQLLIFGSFYTVGALCPEKNV